ncbi:MAG: hypothetical protein D6765_04550, partial [Bacteroidetes bacterium]
MRTVDRLMETRFQVGLLQMMEHAGRNLARLALTLYPERVAKGPVWVLAGKGGNGGGALVAARRLHGWGVRVELVRAFEGEPSRSEVARQFRTLEALGVPLHPSPLPS